MLARIGLGRYTHRIALSNDRILALGDDGTVNFQYKDYRSSDAHRSRSMTVTGEEFIRAFSFTPSLPGFSGFVTMASCATASARPIWSSGRQLLEK